MLPDAHAYLEFDDRLRATALENGEISICGALELHSIQSLRRQLRWVVDKVEPDAITIMLQSPGGSVFAGMGIYDVIRELANVPVHIHGVGLVASAAVLVMQAGDKRTATPNTRFLMHEPRNTTFFTDETTSDAEEQAVEMRELTTRLGELMADRAKVSAEELAQLWWKRDYWFWAAEAKELGLIDGIIGEN